MNLVGADIINDLVYISIKKKEENWRSDDENCVKISLSLLQITFCQLNREY